MAENAKLALWVRLVAKSGKENEVDQFLRSAVPLVQQETGTTSWFAIRLNNNTFGIFDTFADETGRQAHLQGQVAAALMAKAGELLAEAPQINKVDVLASVIPDKAANKAA
ncbi:MAG TPA: antibiotic biosynthesis monooxygenase [Candidatus Limnocylindrales bacterium]|jgi:quinol monooxygenase YgiN|nr:antibiotic biosynthesis monooxygenase [Candidatus Limnocylindrales bacterium]